MLEQIVTEQKKNNVTAESATSTCVVISLRTLACMGSRIFCIFFITIQNRDVITVPVTATIHTSLPLLTHINFYAEMKNLNVWRSTKAVPDLTDGV